jgi:hypothetical protein
MLSLGRSEKSRLVANMKVTRIISIGVPFILGVGAGWIIQGRHWDVFLTSYVPALATLVAAFYGAKYAFQFQKDKEVEDSKKSNIINGNSTIFNMMRMASDLTNYQRQIIDPVRGRPTYFLEMRPTPYFDRELVKLNIEKLYFLLDTEDKNLLGELVTEETRYQSALVAILKEVADKLTAILQKQFPNETIIGFKIEKEI